MWPLQSRLAKGIWHTTHPKRLISILVSGLKSQPDVPERERWKTSRGPEYYPFVRKIGGVSLFDFTDFRPEKYDHSHPLSSWRAFVPHRDDWGGAAWVEIDRDALGDRFICAGDLVKRWDEGGHHRHAIMPRIECACIGDVPVSAFRSVFVTWFSSDEVRDISMGNDQEADYRAVLAEWWASTSGGSVG